MVTHFYFLLSYACWEFAYSQHLYLLKVKRERNTVFQQLNMIEFLKVLYVCVCGGMDIIQCVWEGQRATMDASPYLVEIVSSFLLCMTG